jgi:acyl-coenzyme A thioesterase PaaI-like protein
VTDIPSDVTAAVPSRLGVTARFEDGELVLDLTPRPEVLHHGIVRASVLSFVVDAAAGIPVDDDASVWTLTTDMTVRARPVTAPRRISAHNRILRRGRRSVTCAVELTADDGQHVASGAIGFAAIPRRDTDPPKPDISQERLVELFSGLPTLSRPLREEAGIEVIDAVEGVVEVEVTPQLRNPAGTLQGAMVALLAEAAAEELVASRFESPCVVTDLDLRYLAQAQVGPVRTRCRVLGDGPGAPIEIELVDTSNGRTTTLVYARAVPV